MRAFRLVVALAAAAVSVPAAAQGRAPSVELGLGFFAGGGGDYAQTSGVAMDALIAVPVRSLDAGTLLLGVTGGISGLMTSELVCHPQPDDSCRGDFPVVFGLGVLGGLQRPLGAGFTGRALAGAGYYQATEGAESIGVQGRLDLARTLIPHTALVASTRLTVLPAMIEGETLTITAFQLGLRIH